MAQGSPEFTKGSHASALSTVAVTRLRVTPSKPAFVPVRPTCAGPCRYRSCSVHSWLNYADAEGRHLPPRAIESITRKCLTTGPPCKPEASIDRCT